MSIVEYGVGGYDEAKPDSNIVSQTPVAVDPKFTNSLVLREKANQALVNNATFLAILAPTAAQSIDQVQALTRQVNGLIRLLLNALDDVSDT